MNPKITWIELQFQKNELDTPKKSKAVDDRTSSKPGAGDSADFADSADCTSSKPGAGETADSADSADSGDLGDIENADHIASQKRNGNVLFLNYLIKPCKEPHCMLDGNHIKI